MAALLKEEVTEVHHWTDNLFSFKTTRNPGFRFKNGHFTMIGLEHEGRPLLRAYSLASANYEDELEFFSIKVPDGPLTSKLQNIRPGDQVLVQNPIGIDLADGEPFDVRLTINGVSIPPREYVVSEALNRATYQPGDEQTLESLEAGENCVLAEYWLVREGPEATRTTRWCFTAV